MGKSLPTNLDLKCRKNNVHVHGGRSPSISLRRGLEKTRRFWSLEFWMQLEERVRESGQRLSPSLLSQFPPGVLSSSYRFA